MNIDMQHERRIAEEDRRFQEFQATKSNAPFVKQPQPEMRGSVPNFILLLLGIPLIVFAGLFSLAFVKTMDFLWKVAQ
jgi:hypothetical protein